MMNIYFAVIMHEFGSTGFCSRSGIDLTEQIWDWVKENDPDAISVGDYFEKHPDELLFEHVEILKDY